MFVAEIDGISNDQRFILPFLINFNEIKACIFIKNSFYSEFCHF